MTESFESRCFREVANRLAGCTVKIVRGGSVQMALDNAWCFHVWTWRSARDFLFGGIDAMSVFEFISDEIRSHAMGFISIYSDFAVRNAWAASFAGCASPEELALKMEVAA